MQFRDLRFRCGMSNLKNGRDDIIDNYLPGRPVTSTGAESIAVIEQVLRDNQHVKIKEISNRVGISYGSVPLIIHNYLQYRKLYEKWVRRILMATHKEQR